MNIVTTIVTPIITGVVIGGFALWILFLLFKGIKKIAPNFNFWLKYTIFRKKFDEKVVMWCMDALSKEMDNIKSEKFLLMKGVKPKRMKEVMYIYEKVREKLLKRGEIKDEQLRQSNKQTKIPEIN